MTTVIKNNSRRKRRKKTGEKKKTQVRRDSNLGPLSQHYGFTTRPRGLGLSHLELACSAGVFLGRANFFLAKAHVESRKEGGKMWGVKRSGVGGGKREQKTPARKHCENEKHPLIIALDLSSENEKPTNQHRKTIVPKAPFTSDKIKINTSVVYIMQAASCLREGEYCRLIRVSVIIVGYVRFSLKLNLEAILERKAILLQYFFLPFPSPRSFFRPSTYP